jgi:hypothetical protein
MVIDDLDAGQIGSFTANFKLLMGRHGGMASASILP